MDLGAPELLASTEVDGLNQPVVHVLFPLHQVAGAGRFESWVVVRFRGAEREVQAHPWFRPLSIVDDRGQEDLVTPHDRCRPAQSLHGGLPGDVLGLAPGQRQTGGVAGNWYGVAAAKSRPVHAFLGG